MFLTTHALIGALIGIKLSGHAFLAFIFGFISHFIIDAIPHGDEKLFVLNKTRDRVGSKGKLYSIIGFDCFLTILLLIFATYYRHPETPVAIIFGVLGSTVPDLLWGMHEQWGFKILHKYHDFHLFFHKIIKRDISFKKGVIIQIAVLIVFLKWIL